MSGSGAWLVGGLLLGALELVAPGVFLLWVGLAACGTGLVTAAFRFGWHGQLATFVMLALALVGLVAMRRRAPVDTVNAPNAGLIGQTCYALEFEAGEGRVRLRDGTWQARLAAGATPAPNAAMRVTGLDGTILLVTPLTASTSSSPEWMDRR